MGGSYKLLSRVKDGSIRALILHFAIHGISAIPGRPDLVAKLLAEILTWCGLTIANLSIHEELAVCELANKFDHLSIHDDQYVVSNIYNPTFLVQIVLFYYKSIIVNHLFNLNQVVIM